MLVLLLGNDESPQIARKKRATGYVHVDYNQFSETAKRECLCGFYHSRFFV
jgi:hypothetical protein